MKIISHWTLQKGSSGGNDKDGETEESTGWLGERGREKYEATQPVLAVIKGNEL